VECVAKCEFQEFDGNYFECKLYDDVELNVKIENGIKVFRCKECIDEGIIGEKTKDEYARKLKQHLGWLMDAFYSLKDDMEQEITHIYRLVKELEEDENVNFSTSTSNRRRKDDVEIKEI